MRTQNLQLAYCFICRPQLAYCCICRPNLIHLIIALRNILIMFKCTLWESCFGTEMDTDSYEPY